MGKTRLQDMPTKHDGDGYVTLNGEILPAFKITKLIIKVETISSQKRFLNERVEQNAVRGLKVSGTVGFYATSLALMKSIEAYKNGGEYPNITVQGWCVFGSERREVLLTGVTLSSLTMIDLDDTSDDEVISECDVTANDYQIIQ